MRLFPPALSAVAAGLLVVPAAAQDNTITLGIFVTVRTENVAEFEQAGREHNAWHASQNDPQPWVTYQAVTGRGEYAVLAPDMTWASMDAPVVDMATDVAQWAETGAQYVETEESVIWTDMPGGNPPEDAAEYPIVQVYEFEVNSGGQPVVENTIARASEALSRTGIHFQWSAVISQDGPPSVFLALWFRSFAELGTPAPGPDRIMADAFGPGQGARILNDFAEATAQGPSQIWVLRPDLSYMPGM